MSHIESGWLKRKHEASKDLFSPPKKKHCAYHIGSNESATPFFQGISFCLSNHLIHEHKALRNKIEQALGTITPFLSKVSYYVSNEEESKFGSYKYQEAKKKSIPIVKAAWIDECWESNQILPTTDYLLYDPTKGSQSPAVSYFATANTPTEKDSLEDIENLINDYDQEPISIPESLPRPKHWGLTKIYSYGATNEPYFPDSYEIKKTDTLAYTDINNNENKFYSMEFHCAKEGEREYFRVFTNYGRIDDLQGLDDNTHKECRYLNTRKQAEIVYDLIYQDKTAIYKGYQKIDLAAAKIGSSRLQEQVCTDTSPRVITSGDTPEEDVSPEISNLVDIIFQEATNELTSKISARVTSRGIETPLGLLTKKQISKGEEILEELQQLVARSKDKKSEIQSLSSKFYTLIPHSLGSSSESLTKAVLDDPEIIEEKKDLLQLMRDMTEVINHRGLATGFNDMQVKYRSLGCCIRLLRQESSDYRSIMGLINASSNGPYRVQRIFQVKRDKEWKRFTECIFNARLLFHGSRIDNWLGILSRGLIMPKQVVRMGVHRTDVGFMGYGIYFAERFDASAKYCTAAKTTEGSRLMAVCSVALGNIYHLTKADSSLTKPPLNYHSCHGIQSTIYETTDFEDSEFAIYHSSQYRLEYLVEFTSTEIQADPGIKPVPGDAEPIPQKSIISEENPLSTKEITRRSWLFELLKNEKWKSLLQQEREKEYFIELEKQLESEYNSRTIYPRKELIFAALEECPLSRVKVVILGQDPYHDGSAEGLAFSCSFSKPPSLRNIFKELKSEIPNFKEPKSGSLRAWCQEGVLLLNTVLTVRSGEPNSHKELGWQHFTDAVLRKLDMRPNRIVFLLWGNEAKTKARLILNPEHRVLQSSHPSPYSVSFGFSGCGHFVKANQLLKKANIDPVHWHLCPPDPLPQTTTRDNPNERSCTTNTSSGFVLIKELSPFASNISMKLRVLYKSAISSWQTSKSGKGLFFQLELMDELGDTIKASAYNNEVTLFHNRFECDRIYVINNFNVKICKHAYDKFYRTKNPLHIIFRSNTRITEIPSLMLESFPTYQPKWVSLKDILTLPNDTIVDVVGCVTHIGELTHYKSRKGNNIPARKITLRDTTNEVELSLWYKTATSPGISTYSVIAFTGVLVNVFRGKISLSTKHAAFRMIKDRKNGEPFESILLWARKKFPKPAPSPKATTTQSILPSPLLNVTNSLPVPTFTRTSEQVSFWQWSKQEVINWLTKIGLGHYSDSFANNDIQGKDLANITNAELQNELHVKILRDRRLFHSKLTELRGLQPPAFSHVQGKARIYFLKDTSYLLSSRDADGILKALQYYQTQAHMDISALQQLLIHIHPSKIAKLNSLSLTNYKIPPDLLLPSILATSQRNYIKRIAFKKVPVLEMCDINYSKGCLDPHDASSTNLFRFRILDKEEQKMPIVVKTPKMAKDIPKTAAVVGKEEFLLKFKEFTANQLEYLNWENCLVAGGSILACLCPWYTLSQIRASHRKYNADDAFCSSDIDIFLVGIPEDKIDEKIREIYDSLCQANDNEIIVVRTKHCVSFVSQYPFRTVQVIVKEMANYVEVIGAFDLDCISMGFDGNTVWVVPNTIRSLQTRTNFLEQSFFQYGAMLERIVKYKKRGFGCRLYHQDLLHIEIFTAKMESRLIYVGFLESSNRARETGDIINNENSGGYDDSYIPYGPTHNAASIEMALKEKLKSTNKPFFIVGSLSFCLDKNNVPSHFVNS